MWKKEERRQTEDVVYVIASNAQYRVKGAIVHDGRCKAGSSGWNACVVRERISSSQVKHSMHCSGLVALYKGRESTMHMPRSKGWIKTRRERQSSRV